MNYLDYFDEKERDIPFTSGLESTAAYLRWYDMFLQAAAERQNGVEDSKLRAPLQAAAGILGSRVMASEGRQTTGEFGLSIVNVAAEYGLYDFSFFCLLMAVAQEMDGHYILGYSALSEDLPSKVPTFALAQDIYSVIADGENVFDIGRIRNALEYCPLFTITRSVKGQGSLFDSFEANRQLTALLKGDYVLPNELSMLGGEYSGEDASKAIVYKEKVAALSNFIKALDLEAQKKMEKSELPMDTVIQIAGKRDCGYLDFIRHGIGIDKNILTMDFTLLQAMDSEKYRQVVDDYLVRARLLKDELVILTGGSEDETAINLLLKRILGQLDRVFVVTDENTILRLPVGDCQIYKISLPVPSGSEQQDLWKKELSQIKTSKDVDPKDFAGRYRLRPDVITRCARLSLNEASSKGKKTVSAEDITGAVLANTTSVLDSLCDRMPLSFTWDDLVVDEKQRKIMDTLVSRVRNRNLVDEEWGFNKKVPYGRGVSMIMYGPPGTGKTMAAQVMAKEIGMALYRVDLSQLVDKYIGETEKNIGKIFDAASDGNVILFFDEADSLFSKRTEVSSSNDKHANTEVAYLLQKIEQHDGISFLATNRFGDFDKAFVRRITYAVHLERPDEAKRLELFEKILPDKTPRDKDLNLKYFADTFDLSGSEIKEVLYSAAFIAAREGADLGNRHISEAIRYQQEKTGKVFQGADFGSYY
ncbi:MAG: ATP-binding protein [Butyrivibrio sp.]|nr:ATP-binding protein [Butyrivibrio sp.]